MQTLDGQWRVEAVRRGATDFYRLIHRGNVVNGLASATLQRMPADVGVDMADLVDATMSPTGPGTARGVA